jgi:hypothetical protein
VGLASAVIFCITCRICVQPTVRPDPGRSGPLPRMSRSAVIRRQIVCRLDKVTASACTAPQAATENYDRADSIAEIRTSADGRAVGVRSFLMGFVWRWLQAERSSEARMSQSHSSLGRQQTAHCHYRRRADRDSRQRVSRRRARLGGLSALAPLSYPKQPRPRQPVSRVSFNVIFRDSCKLGISPASVRLVSEVGQAELVTSKHQAARRYAT